MTEDSLLRLGSRASPLARTQTEWVASQLSICHALVWIKSEGDADRTTELKEFGGQGVFTQALHKALFEDRIDAAVHSLKDLPAGEEAGIQLACVPPREDPHDALISRGDVPLEDLPRGARIGTGSPRRAAQLLQHRPDLVIEPLRGNVDTRLKRVADGDFDATLLAVAGLRRLGKREVVSQVIPFDVMLPAAGQGALGITVRDGDATAEQILHPLRDVKTAACVAAERAALHALGAGCHAPVGALAEVEDGRLDLEVRVLSLDGTQIVSGKESGSIAEAVLIGRRLAARLIEDGARPLLEAS